jgi:hypothetical protein
MNRGLGAWCLWLSSLWWRWRIKNFVKFVETPTPRDRVDVFELWSSYSLFLSSTTINIDEDNTTPPLPHYHCDASTCVDANRHLHWLVMGLEARTRRLEPHGMFYSFLYSFFCFFFLFYSTDVYLQIEYTTTLTLTAIATSTTVTVTYHVTTITTSTCRQQQQHVPKMAAALASGLETRRVSSPRYFFFFLLL